MRYTRYNYNKRRGGRRNNGNSFLLSFMIIVVLASVLGILVGKLVLKDGSIPISKPEDEIVDNSNNSEGEVATNADALGAKEVYFLQCGVFSVKESADALLQTLPNGQRGFTVQEGDKFRAIVGIFTPEEVDGKSKVLTDAGISNMKVKFRIDAKNDSDKIKIEILNGYTKILSQFNDSKIQAFKTDEFKKWIGENEGKVNSNDEEIKALIDGIKALPETIDKSGAAEINKKLYEILKKYRV